MAGHLSDACHPQTQVLLLSINRNSGVADRWFYWKQNIHGSLTSGQHSLRVSSHIVRPLCRPVGTNYQSQAHPAVQLHMGLLELRVAGASLVPNQGDPGSQREAWCIGWHPWPVMWASVVTVLSQGCSCRPEPEEDLSLSPASFTLSSQTRGVPLPWHPRPSGTRQSRALLPHPPTPRCAVMIQLCWAHRCQRCSLCHWWQWRCEVG